VKFGIAIFEIRERTERQTDKQTNRQTGTLIAVLTKMQSGAVYMKKVENPRWEGFVK